MSGSWRYRVIRDRDGWCRVAEVHTMGDGGVMWTTDPVRPGGSTAYELARDLRRMLAAALDPVLIEADLEKDLRVALDVITGDGRVG